MVDVSVKGAEQFEETGVAINGRGQGTCAAFVKAPDRFECQVPSVLDPRMNASSLVETAPRDWEDHETADGVRASQERIIDLVWELRVEVVQFPSMSRRNRVASENKSLAVGFIHKIRRPSASSAKLERPPSRERLAP